ncbi:hypothetical protein, partial [Chryseobacterium sp.]|uniref:hypothetical protein n=1 Tax=Chryseobacterium sp. TaxID=1871047 RepID=UPI002FC6C7B4
PSPPHRPPDNGRDAVQCIGWSVVISSQVCGWFCQLECGQVNGRDAVQCIGWSVVMSSQVCGWFFIYVSDINVGDIFKKLREYLQKPF